MSKIVKIRGAIFTLSIASLPLEAIAQACLVSEMQSFPTVYSEDFGTGTGRSSDPNVLNHAFTASGAIGDDFYAVGRSLDLSGTYMRTAGNVDGDGDTNGRYLGVNMRGKNESPPSWQGEFYRQNSISLVPPTMPTGATLGGFRFSTDLAGTCIGCSDVPNFTLILEDSGTSAQLASRTSASFGVVNDGNWRTASVDVVALPATTTALNLVLFNSQPSGAAGNDVGVDNIEMAPLVCLPPEVEFTKAAEIITSNVGEADAAEAGDLIRYTYTVRNSGTVTAYNVSVTEGPGFTGTGTPPFPAVFSGAADLDSGNGTATDVAPGQTLVFRADYVIQQADIDAGGVVDNQADLAMETLDGTEFDDVSDGDDAVSGDQVTTAIIPIVAVDDTETEPVIGATVTIDILDNDGAPTVQGAAQAATVSLVAPGTATSIVTDGSGDIVGFTVPTQGTWSYSDATGALEFDPIASFTGDPTPIEYTVEGTNGATSNPASVSIEYGDGPVTADDDAYSTVIAAVTHNPLLNDSDPDGTLDATSVVLTGVGAPAGSTLAVDGKTLTVPNEGVWQVHASGQITFTPDAALVGDPTPAPYTVADNSGNMSAPATVTVSYVDGPIATNDVVTTPVSGPVSVNVIANDTGGAPLDATSVVFTGTGAPSGATLAPDGKTLTVTGEGVWTVDNAGLVTFTPESGFTGTPTPAAYTVSDVSGAVSNEATIAFAAAPTISAAADALSTSDPVAGGTTASVLNNDQLNGSTITDPALVTLTPGAAPAPTAGSITMNADGTITVAPNTTPGTYSYSYEICDAANPTNCATAVATVVVGSASLLDEIAPELVAVLEEDRAATVSQLGQQMSGYAADAGRRLRNRGNDGNACLAGVNAILDRENILFDTDKAIIKSQSGRVLDAIAEVLRGCAGTAFEIAGHTDSDASDAYNLDLSQRRVNAVLRALQARDVDTTGYVARGYGESRPIASNATAAGKALNRRVEFLPLGAGVALGDCEQDQHVRSLDASANGAGASVNGQYLRDTHDCWNDVRRVVEGSISYLETDEGLSQTMLNLSYRRDRVIDENSLRGYFAGLYVSKSDITGTAEGEIEGLGVNGGIYGAERIKGSLMVDYYLGAAAGLHDFELAFDATSGPITATGDYTYYAAFAGAALSGELEFGDKTVAPRVGIDYVYSPESDVDVTALNGAPISEALELSSLSGGRFFAEVATEWDVNDGVARVGVTPRVSCYQSIEGLGGACGVGGSIDLSSTGDATGLIYSVSIDAEFGDGYDRGALTGSIERRLSVGTVSGSAKFAPEGSASLFGGYELKF